MNNNNNNGQYQANYPPQQQQVYYEYQQQQQEPLLNVHNDHQQRSDSDVQREVARLKKEKLLKNLGGEMVYSVLFSIVTIIVLAVNKDSHLQFD